ITKPCVPRWCDLTCSSKCDGASPIRCILRFSGENPSDGFARHQTRENIMRGRRFLRLSPLLLFILPAGLHAQIASIQRQLYGSPLIDSVPGNQFPGGGRYTAVIQGGGLANVTGFVATNLNVTGTVRSASDTAVTAQISSTPVKE